MSGRTYALGALFAVATFAAPVWAELTFTEAGLPDDSGWTSTAWTAGDKTLTEDTAFTGVTGGSSSAITVTATGYNLSLSGSGTGTQITWNGTIAADTIYLKQGRFSPANSASLGFLGSAKVYIKGQFFADAWASGATATGISLSNEFYLAPSTYTEGNFNNVSIRVHDGNLALTGKVTLLPASSTEKGTVKVKTGNAASANRTLTLSQLDLTKVAVGGNTTECLTVEGDLKVVFANGATLNLPASVANAGWVKVLTDGKADATSFEALTVQLDGAAVDSNQYTVVKNAATGSVKVAPAREPVSLERTLSTANEHWTAGVEEALWGSAGVNPSEIDSVTLAVGTPSELTLSEETTVASLTLNGPSALTFKPTTSEETTTGSLTVLSSTAVNTDTDVSDITATLGTVTLASGKTLTMNGLAFSAMTNNGGALCFKGGTANSTLLQTFDGKMTLRDGANVTLPDQYAMTSAQRFIADSGTATLTLYNINESDGVVDTDGDETIQVKNGAQLTLKARDLGGWNGYRGNHLVVAVRGTGSKITAGAYDAEPGCFVGRVVLADGGEIAGGSTASAALDFYGDTSTNADYPEIYVSSGTGTWSGYLWRNKGLVVKVAEGATFVLSGTLKSKDANNKALTKVGAGEMKITAAQTENSGAYIINEGQLTFSTETELTLSNTISGTGTLGKSGAGTLTLTGTLSNFTGRLEVAEGTLVIPAGKESADSTIGAGAQLALVLSSEQLAAGYTSPLASESIVFKKEVNGSLVDVTAEDGTTENGKFTPNLNTWEGDTKKNGIYAWSDDANWSKGSAPAAGDHVVVALGEGIGMPTLTADTTVAALSITGRGELDLAGFTLTANRIKGESQETTTLTLKGTGTVKLNASTTLERKTLETLSLTVPSGVTLATELTGNDGNPIFENVAIAFADGASWMSHGWLELAGTVTVENGSDLALAMLKSAPPSIWGEGTLKKLGAGTLTINGMGGTHANPLVIEAGTLNLTSDSTATFSGGISGAGALKIGSGTVILTQANTYTGGTEIASDATLKLTATAAQTLLGNLSGSGALAIGDGTAAATVALTGLNEGYSGTITVAERSTLSNGTSEATVPFGKGSIVNNGLLKLTGPAAEASTVYAQLPPVSGSGDITFCSESATRIAGAITTTGTVTIEGTQKKSLNEETTITLPAAVVVFGRDSRDFTNASASIEGPSIAIGAGATLARNDEASSVTIADGRTLSGTGSVSGTGTIGVPITFAKGSVLDATSDVGIALTGKVTGTIYVKLTAATTVLTTTSDAELDRTTQLAFASDATSQTFAEGGYRFVETQTTSDKTVTHSFTVMAKVTLSSEISAEISGSDEALNAIYNAVAMAKNYGPEISTVTAVKVMSTDFVTEPETSSPNALALFKNLYALATAADVPLAGGIYEGTVTVYYDFGISEMHVKSASLVDAEAAQLYVLLCAKVATLGTVPADYASDTTVTLYKGEAALNAVEPTNEQLTAMGLTPTAGEKWFAVPMADLDTGTHAFTVHASQTTP